MKEKYDVIVVGAGPAGSIAAMTAARHGLEVLLIEKRQEIGDPVRCAEGVPIEGLSEFVEPDPRWICAEISDARLYAPDGTRLEFSDKRPVGYVLERKIFDRTLAASAARAGAEVHVKTQAVALLKEEGLVCGIRGKRRGEDFEARAKVVVGADGVESRIGKWAGIDTTLKLKDVGSCVQFHVTGIGVDTTRCEFYMGSAYAPGGYIWVFPKGKHEANIGMGMLGNHVLGKPPLKYLSEFMGRCYPEGKVISIVTGAVPASDLIPRLSAGGLVLAGDAGRLCDPLIGGGIVNGMRSGRIAGDVIAEAIRSRDVSAAVLQQYDREIGRTIGNTLRSHYRVKERLLNLSDEHINALMGHLVPFAPMIPTSMVMMELFGTGNPLLRKLIRPVFNYVSIAGSMTTNRAPFV